MKREVNVGAADGVGLFCTAISRVKAEAGAD